MEKKQQFDRSKLTEKQREDLQFIENRITKLQESRQNHYGVDLDALWQEADRAYVPHRLKGKGKKVISTDEEKGWRGSMVEIGASDWQSDISQGNPFIKIQIALSILIDQNPSGAFTAASKKFENTTLLIKQLYQRSWETAKSKAQLKLFVFNLAKYGWAIARTYPLRIVRKSRVLTEYDPEKPESSKYEDREVVEYNDIFRENLDPRNCWIDDMAKPNNPFSMRDWVWRKVYPMDAFEDEFGKYGRAKYVQPGGNTEETVRNLKGASIDRKTENLVEVLFYENRLKDLYAVVANGVPVILEPLPVSDARGLKKLSCWQAYWNLRHTESVYGIGIYEAIRYEQALLDRIRNMTIDQLTMSIYKMFFYQGTQALTETGDISIKPGVGKQVLDPKNVNWLQIPGPGREAWEGLQVFKQDLDEASGITDPLMGVVTGKTAFELAQAKESALKRLKNPLDNVLDALNDEGYITVSLIQLLYSIPETVKVTDPKLIEAYLKEVESDPELWQRDEEGNFEAKLYPEFPLNLDKDEKGNLIETKDTRFFRVRPKFLNWEGIINIKSQSLLTPSKQIDKALDLEMYNILIPLLVQPPEIYGKVAKNIVKLYDKDPEEILPDAWTEDPQANMPLFVPAEQAAQEQMPMQPPQTKAPSLVGSVQQPTNQKSLIGKIMGRLSSPFRRI